MVLTAASLLLSRAVRPASAALSIPGGGGDRRRGPSAPASTRLSPGRSRPPPAGRVHIGAGGGSTRVSGVPLAALSQASGLVRGGSGGDSSLLFGAAAAEPGACSAGAGRTMLSCQLVRASNLPSPEEGPAQRPGRQPDFQGESPVAAAPARHATPARAPQVGRNYRTKQARFPPCQQGQKSQGNLGPVFFRGSEEDAVEQEKCHGAQKFWKPKAP